MKKRILTVAFVCIGIMLFTNCQKQNPKTQPVMEQPVPDQKNGTDETVSNQRPTPGTDINACYSKYFKFCWELVKCNCVILKEIVINGVLENRIRQVSEKEDPIAVAELFGDAALKDITDRFSSNHLDSLLSGRYYLSVHQEADKVCIFAGPQSPVVETNADFMFQYDKKD